MKLPSINIGTPTPIGDSKTLTGIFKHPATGEVHIGMDGIANDAVLDTKHHGGPDQAIYIYFQPDYDYWVEQLGEPLAPGTFGENLTISDLQSTDVAIGDRLTIGDLVLEVTAPRKPCNVLAQRMNDKFFVKSFTKAGRPGAYARVISEGTVSGGDAVIHTHFAGDRVTISEMLANISNPDTATITRYLATPLAARMRKEFEDKRGEVR